MKKIHLFRLLFCTALVAMITSFAGCSKNNGDDDLEIPTLELSTDALSFDQAGGAKTFDIITTGKWTITGAENAAWAAVTPALSGTGSNTITVTVGQSDEVRSVTLTVKVFTTLYGIEKEVDTKTVKVTQNSSGDPSAITIPELNAACVKAAATETVLDAATDRHFEAVVMNDVPGGDYSYNNLILMTEGATTAGNGITLYGSQVEPSTLGLNMGDKVKVTLYANKAKVVVYQTMNEVTGAKDDTWCKVEKVGTATVTPVEIASDKIADYQGMAVKIKDATLAGSGVWCTASEAGQPKLTTSAGEFSLYIKAGAADFVDQPYVAATGDIMGIAVCAKNNTQLTPRNLEDVKPFWGAISTEPKIVSVTPASLIFAAAGESKTVTVAVRNADGLTLKLTPSAPFTATLGENNVVTVVAPKNEGAAIDGGTLKIELLKADNTVADMKTVDLSQLSATETGNFKSMDIFTVTADNSANGVYSLTKSGVDSKVNGEAATGMKFGTAKKTGVFTSGAVGVTGDKTLTLYGVAWNNASKEAKLYVRVNGGGTIDGSAEAVLVNNSGAKDNPPFADITVSDANKYTFSLKGLTAASTVTFSTSADFTVSETIPTDPRAVVFGIQLN